ncbi:MAG: SusF/SusE family outer membrane protein [Bacteroides graminisolvens]|nr:SusF/SusE family outer membrane protein [Bacteroides graminisolvens]
MKKIALYMLMLASALVACDEDFNEDVAAPQSWEQEDGKSVSFSATAASAIDLATVTADSVAVCSFTAPPVSEGQTITGFDLSFDQKILLNLTPTGKVATADLQSAVTQLFGKLPEARTMKGVVHAYMKTNGQVFRASSDTIDIIVTPVAPDMALQLYVPGAHQDWKPELAPIIYCQNFDMKYDGYVNFTAAGQAFKFTAQPSWEGTNYGNGGDGTLSTDADAGNMSVTEAGYYRLTANLATTPMTYTVTKTVWGIIGDATPGSWDTSTDMTYNATTGEWTVTAELTGGEKVMKFRANNAWDINLGGNASNLTYGGDNMSIAESGTYLITLNLSDPKAYKCTIVKQ